MTEVWVVFILVVTISAAIVALLNWAPAGALMRRHIPDTPRRRILLSSITFFLTFAGVRALTWSIHNGIGPFHDIHMGDRHIHHLVWGILLLLAVRLRLDDRRRARGKIVETLRPATALYPLWDSGSTHAGRVRAVA